MPLRKALVTFAQQVKTKRRARTASFAARPESKQVGGIVARRWLRRAWSGPLAARVLSQTRR